jgi:ferredoxin-NADP reductase
LRSLAREARARGHTAPRHLLYTVRSADDIAYATELERWPEDHGGRAVVTVTRNAPEGYVGRRGRIDAALVRPLVGATMPLCFLCGPAPMVEELTHLLSQLGVPADRVRTEQWTPAL